MADLLSSSWVSTTPGNPRMCTGSPTWTPRESARGSIGKESPSTFRRARSLADISLTGGLYFFTSALSRPLAVTTKIWGWRLTLAVGSTASSSLRLAASSRSGASPGCSPIFLSIGGRQAVVTARWACWFASQRGGSWAGWTTWPLVISQPSASRNQPVPVSRKTGGVIFWGPAPIRSRG